MTVWVAFTAQPPPHTQFFAAEACEFWELLRVMLTGHTPHTPAASSLKIIPPLGMSEITTLGSLEEAGNSIANYLLEAAAPRASGTHSPFGVSSCTRGKGEPRQWKAGKAQGLGAVGSFPVLWLHTWEETEPPLTQANLGFTHLQTPLYSCSHK